MTSVAQTRIAFNGLFIEDSFARFAKVTICFAERAAVLAMSKTYMKKRGHAASLSNSVLIALSVVGMIDDGQRGRSE